MRFAAWYNDSKYADTKIVIKVEVAPSGSSPGGSPVSKPKLGQIFSKGTHWTWHAVGGAGRVVAEYPGHKIVLSSLSEYFKACFDTWSQDAVIYVDENELPAAYELVKFLYVETLPNNMPSGLVLQLLRLAHRYQVQCCQQSCLKCLSELPEDNWDHSNLLDLLYTSEALGDDATMHVLAVQGKAKLKGVFMDFEKSWQDEAKRRLFCELPESAVLELLECDELHVASENTMATAIQHWMQGPSGLKAACPSMSERFVKSLRVAFLTPSYLVNIFPSFSWVKSCPAATAVITESVRYCLISEDFRTSQYNASGLASAPRWLVPRKGMRGRAVVGEVCDPCSWLWEVRLQQLRDAVTAVEQSEDKSKFLYGPGFWFNGLCMRACFQVFKVPDEFFGKIFVGLHCGMGSGMEIPNDVVGIKFELLLTGPGELGLEEGPVFEDHAAVQMNCMWGWSLFNELPAQFNEPFIGHELLTIRTTVKEVC